MSKLIPALSFCLFVLAGIILLHSCTAQQDEAVSSVQAYTGIIASYTSSMVTSDSPVMVRFTEPVAEQLREKNERLFTFSPDAAGTQRWVDERTVEFSPVSRLKNGTTYITRFAIGKVKPNLPSSEVFTFQFNVIPQDLEVRLDPLEPDADAPRERQVLKGRVMTTDGASLSEVRRMVTIRQDGTLLQPEWVSESNTLFEFETRDIKRGNTESRIEVKWNGQPIGADARGQKQLMVSPSDVFELTDVQIVYGENPHINLAFSDLLDESQNMRGLIQIDGLGEPGFVVRNNQIMVFPPAAEPGERQLILSQGIRSKGGRVLGERVIRDIILGNRNPEVRLLGSGVILPDSEELLLPFEAVNLGAVDVQVTRIFESNVPQFMQRRTLSDGHGLQEVGRAVAQEVIALSGIGEVETGKWNSYALDLSKIMKPEPGAIYRVSIGFRKHQSMYPCGDEVPSASPRTDWTQDEHLEQAYWDEFDRFFVQGEYNWREREDPCTPSYYTSDRRASRNMLASELGLIAKRTSIDEVQVFVTDLNTARPLSGVRFEALDYQQQQLGTGQSDREGKWTLPSTVREPHLLIASRGDERAYLRLDDATSLSLSEFDVSGMRVEEGLKGFLYAEREVWRPGDSLFVNMMIEATDEMLPKDHPATFELLDPSGRVADRRVVHPFNRLYSFPTRTASDAVTGRWRVVARLGGNTFSKNVNIETIQPNRLRIELRPDESQVTGPRATIAGTISAEWLHGATASELDTDITMSLREGRLSFTDYPQFSFSDPSRSLETTTTEIFEGQLDSEGNTRFSYELQKPDAAPGLLIAALNTRVFEESGNFSTNRSQIRYVPYNRLTGINITGLNQDRPVLDRDGDYEIETIILDPDGSPVSGSSLTVEIFRLEWNWWWQRRSENLSQYFESTNQTPIFRQEVTAERSGAASLDFPKENLDWGRYLVRVSDEAGEGHSAGEIVFIGWSRDTETEVGGPQRLIVETDKRSYQTGETITLSFPGSEQGRALISIETGTEILDTFWIDTNAGQNELEITATGEMSPNVYASIHVIQPHGQRDNDLPIRMYGIVPVMVENPETRLKPVAQMPDELRPESQASVQVSEEDGRAMTYTIAIVDEGLLDITNFSTPNPHGHFYAREALGVRSWDMYNDVAGTYAGSFNRILAIGGDMDLEIEEEADDITRFKPMVRFMGPFELGEGQTATHQFDVPNYVGSVRTMVVAGKQGAYGNTETRTPVRQPVMVLGTLPRVLSPGERVSLPVSVFAMRDDIESINVSVDYSDIFTLDGPSTQRARFDGIGDQTLRFSLMVDERIGTGRVRIDGVSGEESGYDEIDIEIRNPLPLMIQVYEYELEAGDQLSFEYDPIGFEGTNIGALEVSGIPPVNLTRRMNELSRYPHGCLEQRTSSVFPQLYLHRFTDMSEDQQTQVKRNIEAYISEIERFRHPSYGLSYWPGQDGTWSWSTIYAWHFLIEAEKAGYYVPTSLMRHIADTQRREAGSWRERENRNGAHYDLVQSYRLYVLALSGSPAMGAMNRLREGGQLSVQARWRLAAAYQIAGMPEAAEQLISGAETQVREYRELSHTFGTQLRDQAMIVETLSLMNRSSSAVALVREISARLSSNDWLSTQETAYALIAVGAFIEASGASADMDVTYSLSSLGDGSVQAREPYSILEFDIPDTATQTAEIVNRGEGSVFIRLIQEGIPMMDDQEAVSSNLVQRVRYVNPDGQEANPDRLRQGTDIIAEITVTNPGTRGDYTEVALNHMIPSGWEILNTRLDDIAFGEAAATGKHQDIRDDRVLTYFDLRGGESKTFRTRLTATYEGRFYLPAITSYTMYDNTISARTPGRWVEVIR